MSQEESSCHHGVSWAPMQKNVWGQVHRVQLLERLGLTATSCIALHSVGSTTHLYPHPYNQAEPLVLPDLLQPPHCYSDSEPLIEAATAFYS